MPDGIRWVGLDVRARESTFAVFDQASGEVITRRVVGRPHELLPWLRAVERPARMVYEAGPTGYGLARRGLAEGIELGVCAPGRTERPPADRVKTDKRDAVRLARLLAAGELTLVTIPSVEREQLRDLVRCREDIRVDLARARHRIGGFLLLRCLRGIDTLTAVGLCAEIGEWERFDHPDQLRLSRDRPLRAHHRRAAAARVDHQGRLHPRPAAAGRGGLPLPPRPGGR